MPDLRALLGDRYDDVMQAACGCDGTRLPHCFECGDSTLDHECPDPVPCRHRGAGAVLARVLPGLLAERDALAAKVELVREWIDRRGVDVSERDGDYMDGYRAAQRHALHDAAELRRALDGTEGDHA